ncbi:MAG: hypothetical protein ILP19_08675 [Oscillospiraceae bacterium]|nr:hypothetical protein [Oscillospiraceae bacterium]
MIDEEKMLELAPDMLDQVNGGLLFRSIEEDTRDENENEEEEEKTGTNKAAKQSRKLGRPIRKL